MKGLHAVAEVERGRRLEKVFEAGTIDCPIGKLLTTLICQSNSMCVLINLSVSRAF